MEYWKGIINAIRVRPFAEFTAEGGAGFEPNIVGLSPAAYVEWVNCFNRIADRIQGAAGIERIIAAKSDTQIARLALVLHILKCAVGAERWDAPLSVETMKAASILGEWFLNETLRVFECLCGKAMLVQRDDLAKRIRDNGGSMSVRDLQKSNSRRYPDADAARSALHDLTNAGMGLMNGNTYTMTLLPEQPGRQTP